MSDYLCGTEHSMHRECTGCKEIDEMENHTRLREMAKRKKLWWQVDCRGTKYTSKFSAYMYGGGKYQRRCKYGHWHSKRVANAS